jgi:hypothetical protein
VKLNYNRIFLKADLGAHEVNNKFKFPIHSLPLHNAPLLLVSKSQQSVPSIMMAEGSLTSKTLKAFLVLRDKYLISK